jgi:hypothetical protein
MKSIFPATLTERESIRNFYLSQRNLGQTLGTLIINDNGVIDMTQDTQPNTAPESTSPENELNKDILEQSQITSSGKILFIPHYTIIDKETGSIDPKKQYVRDLIQYIEQLIQITCKPKFTSLADEIANKNTELLYILNKLSLLYTTNPSQKYEEIIMLVGDVKFQKEKKLFEHILNYLLMMKRYCKADIFDFTYIQKEIIKGQGIPTEYDSTFYSGINNFDTKITELEKQKKCFDKLEKRITAYVKQKFQKKKGAKTEELTSQPVATPQTTEATHIFANVLEDIEPGGVTFPVATSAMSSYNTDIFAITSVNRVDDPIHNNLLTGITSKLPEIKTLKTQSTNQLGIINHDPQELFLLRFYLLLFHGADLTHDITTRGEYVEGILFLAEYYKSHCNSVKNTVIDELVSEFNNIFTGTGGVSQERARSLRSKTANLIKEHSGIIVPNSEEFTLTRAEGYIQLFILLIQNWDNPQNVYPESGRHLSYMDMRNYYLDLSPPEQDAFKKACGFYNMTQTDKDAFNNIIATDMSQETKTKLETIFVSRNLSATFDGCSQKIDDETDGFVEFDNTFGIFKYFVFSCKTNTSSKKIHHMVIVISTVTNCLLACYGLNDSATIDMLKSVVLRNNGLPGIGKDKSMYNVFRSGESDTGLYEGTIQNFIDSIEDKTSKNNIIDSLNRYSRESATILDYSTESTTILDKQMPYTVFADDRSNNEQWLRLIFNEIPSGVTTDLRKQLAILMWLGVKTICDQLFAAIKPSDANCSSLVSVTSTDCLVGPYTTVAGVLGLTCYIANFWRSVAVGWKFRPGFKTVDKITTAKYITQNIIFLRIVLKAILSVNGHDLSANDLSAKAKELDDKLTNLFGELPLSVALLNNSIKKIAEIIEFRKSTIDANVFTSISGYPNYTKYVMPLFRLESLSREKKLRDYVTSALNTINQNTENTENTEITEWQQIPNIMSVFHSNMVSMYENNDTTIDFSDLFKVDCNNESIRMYIVGQPDFNRDEYIRIRIIAPLDCRAKIQLFLAECSIPDANIHIQEFVGTPEKGRAVTHVQFLVDLENTIGLLFELLKVNLGNYEGQDIVVEDIENNEDNNNQSQKMAISEQKLYKDDILRKLRAFFIQEVENQQQTLGPGNDDIQSLMHTFNINETDEGKIEIIIPGPTEKTPPSDQEEHDEIEQVVKETSVQEDDKLETVNLDLNDDPPYSQIVEPELLQNEWMSSDVSDVSKKRQFTKEENKHEPPSKKTDPKNYTTWFPPLGGKAITKNKRKTPKNIVDTLTKKTTNKNKPKHTLTRKRAVHTTKSHKTHAAHNNKRSNRRIRKLGIFTRKNAITFEDKSSPVIPRTPTQVVPPCSGVLTQTNNK